MPWGQNLRVLGKYMVQQGADLPICLLPHQYMMQISSNPTAKNEATKFIRQILRQMNNSG